MKHILRSFALLLLAYLIGPIQSHAQYPKLTCKQVQEISAADLANCKDTSAYDGDTVTVTGVVIADANLIDVPSSSVQGGYRPFVHIVDTADNGSSGNFKGLNVMGVYRDAGGNSLPVLNVYNLFAGMQIEVTGIIGSYLGETQLEVLNNSSLIVLGNQTKPQPVVIDLGDLNDNRRTNQLETGEQYEGSFVEIQDLTVSAIYNFSGNRVSFDLTDDNGNVINVSDRFLVQKTSSYTTTRASSPVTQGSFTPPVVGTRFEYIRGIIVHSQNGCTGSNGRGYEINPFDTSHYKIGITPPNVSNVVRTPLVPSSSDKVTISARIIDFDGSITGATLYYTDDINAAAGAFTSVPLTLKGGTTDSYEAEIPAFGEDVVVRYYITAVDNDNQTSYVPFNANSSTNPNFMFYTVRNNGLSIVDLQKVLNVTDDASPYEGQEVTVTGIVTASAKAYDLESIFIQDENATEWGGIRLEGNSELIKLFRGEEVTVTGTVSESFGFTTMAVTNVVRTGVLKTVNIPTIDPSDSAFFASREAEKYEGMLVAYHKAGEKIVVSNGRLNPFGEYLVSTSENASEGSSARVQAGIQNNNNSSSLWVSIVSDTALKDDDGVMNVEAIAAEKGMSFDSMVGVLFYGFSRYKLLPRNNDDLVGSSVALSATDYPEYVNSVPSYQIAEVIELYPNPVGDVLNINVLSKGLEDVSLQILDQQGRLVDVVDIDGVEGDVSTAEWSSGLYFVRVVSEGLVVGTTRILKK
jgi:hypothetical protein